MTFNGMVMPPSMAVQELCGRNTHLRTKSALQKP